ncbi:hypothetical protein CEXT_459951 [Caerostris extrusa]|uniref:Uncharacterized protein n=1 Tax=Caerostris extrusa TaxID=172846 RepID=A0AAV4PFT6_CAEEX|nr:hypothetical protein CEXT_459951 [Caerostris extrusa]
MKHYLKRFPANLQKIIPSNVSTGSRDIHHSLKKCTSETPIKLGKSYIKHASFISGKSVRVLHANIKVILGAPLLLGLIKYLANCLFSFLWIFEQILNPPSPGSQMALDSFKTSHPFPHFNTWSSLDVSFNVVH